MSVNAAGPSPLPPDPVVVVTRRWPAAVEDQLRQRFPGVRLNTDDHLFSPEELRAALDEADAVLVTVSDQLTAEYFTQPVRTKFIGNFGVGVNHIDVAAAASQGVTVTNTPGVLTNATADLAILLMLMITRRAGEGEREVRAGEWAGWRPTHLLGGEVSGSTIGVLGMGRIGTAVARRAHFGFGMEVLFHNRSEVRDHGIPGARQCELDEVLRESDVVSLHLPGGDENRHIVDAERLALLKPTAYLVNTARGDVLDQRALITALQRQSIAGAGLDVYADEPEVPEELRELDNVVLLPHLGSNTLQTRTAMGELVLANLTAFAAGQRPPNPVR